jgi:hypothetical protein
MEAKVNVLRIRAAPWAAGEDPWIWSDITTFFVWFLLYLLSRSNMIPR